MNSGWICFYRKITEWEWYSTPNMLHLFFHLVITANHKKKKWQGVDIERGQLVTSINSINSATGISTQSIRTCLKRLESSMEIVKKTTNRFTLITICKYNDYQEIKYTTNKQLTINQQSTNKQLTTNNNVNNVTKEKHLYSKQFENFWKEYPNKTGKAKAYSAWKKYKCENGIFDEIMGALYKQKKSKNWTNDGGKYIPMCSTWVNGKRWEDQIMEDNQHNKFAGAK